MIDTTTPAPVQNRPAATRGRVYRPNSRHVPVLATLALLAFMYGLGIANYDGFSDTQVVLNIFIDNAFLLVVAVGMTFVILTGGIDLSVGSVVAMTTMIVTASAMSVSSSSTLASRSRNRELRSATAPENTR